MNTGIAEKIESKSLTTQRIIYADVLRIVSIFAVIVLHTSGSNWNLTAVSSFQWQIFNLYNGMVRWCVPLFVMLSGMLFLNVDKPISTQKMYTKYIPRIVTALVFWGVLYNALAVATKPMILKEAITVNDIINIPLKIIFGPAWYHLWFLYVIIGLYMLTPLFRLVITGASKKDLEYLLLMFFLLGLCLPLVNAVFTRINPMYKIYLPVPEAGGYAGYYFAGYYFSKYDLSSIKKIWLYILGAFSLAGTITAVSAYSLNEGQPVVFLYENLLPNTMVAACAVFVLFKQLFERIHLSEKAAARLIVLSESSFGIYLIHDFFNQLSRRIGITNLSFNPIVSIPFIAVVNYCLSALMVVWIIRKIPFLKKWTT